MLIDEPKLAEQAGRYMLAVPETLAWYTGGVYEGHSLKRKGSEWLLVVRMALDGAPKVSFTRGGTIGQVFREFAVGIAFDLVDWYPDQYK